MSKQQRTGTKIHAASLLVILITIISFEKAETKAIAQSNFNLSATTQDKKTFDQKQALDELMKKIAGQENKPAQEVFKNIQMMKGTPAGRLIRIMELGYSKSLGVDCTYCHVAGEWDKEDKPTKQVARDMAAMSQTINNDLLKKIKNLKSPNPVVNCTTCHRGQTKPSTNLAEAKPNQ